MPYQGQNPNRDQLNIRSNSAADIRLSMWEYNDMIDALLDDKFTAKGLLTMKHLFLDNSLGLIAVPIVTFPVAWFFTRWLQGNVNRGMASARLNFFGMSIFWPAFLYYGYTRPIPRKLYTDIIADDGPDGAYVRESLKTYKPGLWQNISRQLHNLEFNFSQMHQHKGVNFPSNFVNSRVV